MLYNSIASFYSLQNMNSLTRTELSEKVTSNMCSNTSVIGTECAGGIFHVIIPILSRIKAIIILSNHLRFCFMFSHSYSMDMKSQNSSC